MSCCHYINERSSDGILTLYKEIFIGGGKQHMIGICLTFNLGQVCVSSMDVLL